MRNLTAVDFYRERDNRTNRVANSRDYHDFFVRLIADAGTVETYNGQAQLIIAANLLARWCRQVEFGFPNAQLLSPFQFDTVTTLHQRIELEVREADPFGDFAFRSERSAGVEYTLQVGIHNRLDEPVDFRIDARGWYVLAGIETVPSPDPISRTNPAVAAFAASVGVADAFKVATGIPEASRVKTLMLSLLDFETGSSAGNDRPSLPATLPLGTTQVVGVGSVGSSVIYLLHMLPIEGFIQLIDHDLVEIANLNRSPLFGVSDVDDTKVDVARRFLQPVVSVNSHHGRYDEFIDQYGRAMGEIDLILPLANEYGVRTVIENNYPPLQIYGTTTSDWGVNYHRHIPMGGDCSVCRFPNDQQQARLVCSEARIEVNENERIDAALPFVSMGAAALTVADLIKLQFVDYPFTYDFAFFDLKGPLEFVQTHSKYRRNNCLCSKRSAAIHRRTIADTRFSLLSPLASSGNEIPQEVNTQ